MKISVNNENGCTNTKRYNGAVEGKFKSKYNSHLSKFRYCDKSHSKSLPAITLKLKDKGTNFDIK